MLNAAADQYFSAKVPASAVTKRTWELHAAYNVAEKGAEEVFIGE
jgi:hypothetical protein